MSGAIAAKANDTTKALGAKTSYLIALGAVFARWKNVELNVKVDGEARSGLMEDVIVGIGRYQAGGMMTTPDAEPDDGLFDVLLIKDATKPEVVGSCRGSTRGTFSRTRRPRCCAGVSSRSRRRTLPVQLDGEQPGTACPLRDRPADPAQCPLARRRSGAVGVLLRADELARFGFALGFWSSASCFSSSATRFSSSSRPRSFFWMSSIRSRRPVTLSTTRAVVCEPATRVSAPSPLSASLLRMSCF
jgi:hypothetical protein